MSVKLYFLLAAVLVLSDIATADIIKDLLGWDLVGSLAGVASGKDKSKSAAKREEESKEACLCEGNACKCCVDFNITSLIDLGVPSCVRMRYISQDEGVALNVTYGDDLFQSKVIKQKDKKGLCTDVLSEFAQMCARFDDLRPLDDGLQGCLHFEPHVLGDVTSQLLVGCFRMNPEGIAIDPSISVAEKPTESENQEDEDDDDDDDDDGDDSDDETPSILDVVNQSAEQGIKIFSDLLGISTPGKKTKTTTEKAEVVQTTVIPESESTEEQGDDSSRSSYGSIRSSSGRSYLTNHIA